MKKLNKNQLQGLLESSQRDKQALEARLLDMEALVKSFQSGMRPPHRFRRIRPLLHPAQVLSKAIL